MFIKMFLQSIIIGAIMFDERRPQFYAKLRKRRTERHMQPYKAREFDRRKKQLQLLIVPLARWLKPNVHKITANSRSRSV
jgi:hypothetical protein